MVDLASGRVVSPGQDVGWVPDEPWMGLTAGSDDELVLAAANQQIVILDVARRKPIHRFPALVTPPRRAMTDECAMLAAGTGWIATLSEPTGALQFLDRRGQRLGALRLDAALGLADDRITAMAASGRYLGLGVGGDVRTVEVIVDQDCARRSR
jgi:hypothetical protein